MLGDRCWILDVVVLFLETCIVDVHLAVHEFFAFGDDAMSWICSAMV